MVGRQEQFLNLFLSPGFGPPLSMFLYRRVPPFPPYIAAYADLPNILSIFKLTSDLGPVSFRFLDPLPDVFARNRFFSFVPGHGSFPDSPPDFDPRFKRTLIFFPRDVIVFRHPISSCAPVFSWVPEVCLAN